MLLGTGECVISITIMSLQQPILCNSKELSPHTIQCITFPFLPYNNSNEYGLVIGESTFGGVEELATQPGAIIDYGSLIYLTLQRAKTARTAIKTMVELMGKQVQIDYNVRLYFTFNCFYYTCICVCFTFGYICILYNVNYSSMCFYFNSIFFVQTLTDMLLRENQYHR